jgi:hypothetical protein
MHSRTPALPHSRTPALPHSRTPALPHSRTPALPHSLTSAHTYTRAHALPYSRTNALTHILTHARAHAGTKRTRVCTKRPRSHDAALAGPSPSPLVLSVVWVQPYFAACAVCADSPWCARLLCSSCVNSPWCTVSALGECSAPAPACVTVWARFHCVVLVAFVGGGGGLFVSLHTPSVVPV